MFAKSLVLLAAVSAVLVSAAPSAREAPQFTPANCYADNVNGQRTFNANAFNSNNMTNELCASHCNDAGYPYSGTEYYDQCFCSSTAPSAGSSTQCNTACKGDASQTCGGPDALTVRYNSQIANPNAMVSSDYAHVGCFADSTSSRTISGGYHVYNGDNSVEVCGNFCRSNYPDLAYFGLEYGIECFCGNAPTAASSNQCTTACGGNNSQSCGGTNAINVYRVVNEI